MTPDSYLIAVLVAALLIACLGWEDITGKNLHEEDTSRKLKR